MVAGGKTPGSQRAVTLRLNLMPLAKRWSEKPPLSGIPGRDFYFSQCFSSARRTPKTPMKTQSSQKSRRPSLPLFLYDLSAASRILPPAAVLPEQFYGSAEHADSSYGELALMRAVLEDAVHCFQKSQGTDAAALAKEAERWFFSDEQHWPFSFMNICAALGLNADYIRLGLQRWRQHPPAVPPKKRRRAVLTHTTMSVAA